MVCWHACLHEKLCIEELHKPLFLFSLTHCQYHFSIACHRDCLSQTFIPLFEIASKIAHMPNSSPPVQTKFGNASVEKPLKPIELLWGYLRLYIITEKDFTETSLCIHIVPLWVHNFKYIILYMTCKWHYLNKCANAQYVLETIYPCP